MYTMRREALLKALKASDCVGVKRGCWDCRGEASVLRVKGILARPIFIPADMARVYERGCAAFVCPFWTDKDFFSGHEIFLVEARAWLVKCRVIRKDFYCRNEYQVLEARANWC